MFNYLLCFHSYFRGHKLFPVFQLFAFQHAGKLVHSPFFSFATQVIEENLSNVGATIMGRNMFGGHPGPWNQSDPWQGWWGDNPPFHHPVFVITNYSREPLELDGGTTFYFVTDGIHNALERAFEAADGRDVALGGGANVAQQFLTAGLVGEMELHIVPILLGSGERLFYGVGDDLHGPELIRTIATDSVVHMKFARD